MSIRDWFSGTNIKKKVEGDPRYGEQVRFAQDHEPKDDVAYDWVYAHATDEYKRNADGLRLLDDKADSLIRYLGAGTGVIALAFSRVLSDGGLSAAIHIFPALIALVTAVIYAARARSPEKLPTPLTTRSAFRYAEAYSEKKAMASFAAMTGASSYGLSLASTEKSRLIRWSFRLFVFAVIWLVVWSIILNFADYFGFLVQASPSS